MDVLSLTRLFMIVFLLCIFYYLVIVGLCCDYNVVVFFIYQSSINNIIMDGFSTGSHVLSHEYVVMLEYQVPCVCFYVVCSSKYREVDLLRNCIVEGEVLRILYC